MSLELHHIVDSPDDVVGGDAEHVQELSWRSRPGDGIDGQLPHDHVAVGGNRVQDSVSDTSLITRCEK